MDNIKDVIHSVIGKLASKQIDQGGKLERIWENILEKEDIKHTRILGMNQGKVLVVVDSPAWMYQMRMKKTRLLQKLIDEIPDVKEIRFKIGKV